MRFVGRGHPAIRATHAKTLELSPDPEITARATCIVAVGAEAEPLASMAGRVRIRISAGHQRFSLDADANSSWDPAGPVVVRRSPLRRPGTFATGATASSADLPRELVLALQDPDTLVTVDVAPVPDDRQTVVLAYVDPASSALPSPVMAERDAADTVIAQDDAARALIDARTGDGARTLVLATASLPRNVRPGVRVEVVGLPARLAAAAASPSGGPLLLAEPGADIRAALRDTPATARLVLVTPAQRLADVLDLARDIRGRMGATIAQEYVHPVRIEPGSVPELPISADVAICFDAAAADDAIDPPVRSAISALLADGVATRTAAKALAALTGWDRRRAYDAVVAWPRSAPGIHVPWKA